MLTASVGVAGAQALSPDEVAELPIPGLRGLAEDRARALEAARGRPADIVQAGPVNPETYVLGPGDELEVNLWGRLSRTLTIVVNPEGRIFLPGRGPLEVGGRTLVWARERILRNLAEQFTGVRADVRLTRLRTFKVYVTGEVKSPGSLEVSSATRANEALARDGLADGASRRNIEVVRLDGGRARVDLDLFERVGRQDVNPLLLDGDRLIVPKATEYVDLAGALVRSGRYELARGDSLGTVLEIAGGLLPSASTEQALMVRFTTATERESLFVDLREPRTQAMALRDGDRLFVQFLPEYHKQATAGITGEVERPGTYPIVPGRDRMSDLIRWAGGFRPQANRAAVHLLREPPAAAGERDPELDRLARLSRGQMTESEYTRLETMLAERKNSFRIDWSRVQPGSSSDPLLQEDDVVRIERFVPSVRIEGQVKRPGLVDYAAGRTLGEYIQLAGGFTERSARTSIRVSRSLTGQIIPARSLRSVQPGDFIWVPERRDVDAWGAFRDIVTVAGQVALIIFTLSR
jgi:protein involved in polysaccharide export with SLBB domain